ATRSQPGATTSTCKCTPSRCPSSGPSPATDSGPSPVTLRERLGEGSANRPRSSYLSLSKKALQNWSTPLPLSRRERIEGEGPCSARASRAIQDSALLRSRALLACPCMWRDHAD